MAHESIEVCCVSGANQTQPFAMVMLNEELRPQVQDDAALKKEIEDSLKQLIQDINKQVDPHEQLAFIIVMQDEWTIENSFLTPTLKLKRNVVEDTYQQKVDAWYGQKKPVIWQ